MVKFNEIVHKQDREAKTKDMVADLKQKFVNLVSFKPFKSFEIPENIPVTDKTLFEKCVNLGKKYGKRYKRSLRQ